MCVDGNGFWITVLGIIGGLLLIAAIIGDVNDNTAVATPPATRTATVEPEMRGIMTRERGLVPEVNLEVLRTEFVTADEGSTIKLELSNNASDIPAMGEVTSVSYGFSPSRDRIFTQEAGSLSVASGSLFLLPDESWSHTLEAAIITEAAIQNDVSNMEISGAYWTDPDPDTDYMCVMVSVQMLILDRVTAASMQDDYHKYVWMCDTYGMDAKLATNQLDLIKSQYQVLWEIKPKEGFVIPVYIPLRHRVLTLTRFFALDSDGRLEVIETGQRFDVVKTLKVVVDTGKQNPYIGSVSTMPAIAYEVELSDGRRYGLDKLRFPRPW